MILDTAMNDTRAKVLICIFLIVATFCIYSQVQDHKFINYDDDRYITESSLTKAGFTKENIIRLFTNTHVSLWVPTTSLSFILDYQLYGLNPKGFLLTNLFFHIANSLLLFLVLFRMTGAIWQSAFVAAMFAFHPLNVESVAWAAERKNVLSTLFLLLTRIKCSERFYVLLPMQRTQHLRGGMQTWLRQMRFAKLHQSYGREPKIVIES